MGRDTYFVNKSQFIFPAFNAVLFVLLFALIGYFLNNLLMWILAGIIIGFAFAWLVELPLRRFTPDSWLFRRRVILLAIFELFFILYGIGPFAYVQSRMQASNYDLCCRTPADFGANYDTLSIPTEEGIEIAAWYIPAANPDMATIIISHGAGGNRIGGLWYAEQLFSAGFGVLLYDQRGLGESIGGHPSIGRYDTHDLSYMIDYLVREYSVNPEKIAGLGLSLGANILVTSALPEARLSALWLDGLSPQHYDDFPPAESLAEQFDWSLNNAILTVLSLQTGMNLPSLNEQIHQLSERTITIVAGGADDFEVRSLDVYIDDMNETVETWVIPDVGHTSGAYHDPGGYSSRMLDFFSTAFSE